MKYTNSRMMTLKVLLQAIPSVVQVRVNLTKEEICRNSFFQGALKINGRLISVHKLHPRTRYSLITSDVTFSKADSYRTVDIYSVLHVQYLCDRLNLHNTIRLALLRALQTAINNSHYAYLRLCIRGEGSTFKILNVDVKYNHNYKVCYNVEKKKPTKVIQVNIRQYEQVYLGLG